MATLQQYAVLEKTPDYVNVQITLSDGTSFGQLLYGVTTLAEVDAGVAQAVARVTAAAPPQDPTLQTGVVRMASAMVAA